MARQILYRPEAAADIERCAANLGRQWPRVARRFLEACEAALQKLLDEPHIGRLWASGSPDLGDVRVWMVPNFTSHLVCYRPNATGIEVLRVLHTAQVVAKGE